MSHLEMVRALPVDAQLGRYGCEAIDQVERAASRRVLSSQKAVA
jgi:hypothetical protein